MTYCNNCGAEIKDLAQKFCEQCGSPIPESVRTGTSTSTPATAPRAPSSSQVGGLFDINRNYYILKEKFGISSNSLKILGLGFW
ncbi:MAG: zinc ribbon domain-containing protein [Candidatus Lokiarchaeota archaeon]|nr:zinc ribbon domain-containing protein [Candidatus Lokiarchaeota archaeon]